MRDNFERVSDILPNVMARLGQGRKQGDEFVCCCPFHEERNPSFSLNMEKGVYYCFGCGASGSLSKLANQFGIESGHIRPTLKLKSKKLQPWQRAKRIEVAFDTLEDWNKETYRTKRNKLEMDWNEAIIDEAEYYFQRQLLNHDLDCKMEILDETRNRLTYEAKHGTDNDNE